MSLSATPTPAARRGAPLTHPADVAAAAQLACLLEASAPKPGNISPGVSFHDACYADFLASAAAIGPAMAAAGDRPLGATVLAAVEATRRWTSSNTNLGIVLLFAPLARAAPLPDDAALRARLDRVLDESTVLDTADVYAAIRHARPGGLGRADAEDVADTPTVPLREAMALATERDAIAREYATGFAATFAIGVPALRRARSDGLDWSDATVETYLVLLAALPDTLVARKLGRGAAEHVSTQARQALDAGGVRSTTGRAAVATLDVALRGERNVRNPGTTADLTAAAIFVELLEGGWTSP